MVEQQSGKAMSLRHPSMIEVLFVLLYVNSVLHLKQVLILHTFCRTVNLGDFDRLLAEWCLRNRPSLSLFDSTIKAVNAKSIIESFILYVMPISA